MPHFTGDHLIIASEDNPFWKSFLPPLQNLPENLHSKIRAAYQKSDGTYSMQPFFDLLAIHEFAHAYHEQNGLNMQRKWMQELFANLMLHTFVAEKKPELLPVLKAFPQMVVEGGSSEYKYISLSDFENIYDDTQKGMTAQNYGWYQCNLHVEARRIYETGGRKVLKKLWKSLKKHQENMTDSQFAKILQTEVHPSVANVYLNWNKKQK